MNSLVIFLLVLFTLNILVIFLSRLNWLVWRIAGVIFIISSPIVLVLTMNSVGRNVGDGIAGAVAGFTFGGLLVANAIILFVMAIFVRWRENKLL
ncbi:hypothetical protein ACIQZG_11480 [Lysinibacillus sp. NPDC096418]|uniref:hypothetical protein n=1 Tax=Lysinibacillus sp. NPDC096418 TaxID=3364138 RepID=UPI00382BCE81